VDKTKQGLQFMGEATSTSVVETSNTVMTLGSEAY
jgi:hypothetical protein